MPAPDSSILGDMSEELRFIIWRKSSQKSARVSIRSLLSKYPTVRILKFKDPDYAVVLMDAATGEKIRQGLPDLSIERDLQHRIVSTQ